MKITLFRLDTFFSVLCKHLYSAGPVQMPLIAAFDQGLHSLLTSISMENAVSMEASTRNPLD